jgi:xanthine dehydrogenase accessory factor
MPFEFYKKSCELVAGKKRFAVATVIRVVGSSSALPGSKAIIEDDGAFSGWIGGGCAEGTVRREALQAIDSGCPRVITLDMRDEVLGVGMPCGGMMDVYIEPVLPRPELLIVGHGRIAEAIAAIAHQVNFSISVNDSLARREAFPDADVLVTDDIDLGKAHIDGSTFVVVATQHKGDHLWLQKAINKGAACIALVSSHHRARLVLDYLAANGVGLEDRERIWAPAGLDLGAKTPEEIALSVVSQMIAIYRGGSGAPAKLNCEPSQVEKTIAEFAVTKCREDLV